jgi:hypothetical protein
VSLYTLVAIVVVVSALWVCLLWLSRRSPLNERFSSQLGEHERAFEFLGVAFAVLLAFVVLEAYDNYNDAKAGAEQEAEAVLAMSRTAAAFGPDGHRRLDSVLTCYGRAVVEQAWPAMRDEGSSPVVNYWARRFRDTAHDLDPRSFIEQAAFRQLLEEQDSRIEGRRIRLFEATRTVPPPLWLVLALGAVLTTGWIVVGADRKGSFLVQACVVASVAAMVTAALLLVWFLDHPFSGHNGSIEPHAMEDVLALIRLESIEEGLDLSPPCTEVGDPFPT